MRRFLTWLVLEDGERIVRIKSLRPCIMRDPWGRWELSWPTLLVDRWHGTQRSTMSPIWNRVRFRDLWERTTRTRRVGPDNRA
jgi:hypothetical protein